MKKLMCVMMALTVMCVSVSAFASGSGSVLLDGLSNLFEQMMGPTDATEPEDAADDNEIDVDATDLAGFMGNADVQSILGNLSGDVPAVVNADGSSLVGLTGNVDVQSILGTLSGDAPAVNVNADDLIGLTRNVDVSGILGNLTGDAPAVDVNVDGLAGLTGNMDVQGILGNLYGDAPAMAAPAVSDDFVAAVTTLCPAAPGMGRQVLGR